MLFPLPWMHVPAFLSTACLLITPSPTPSYSPLVCFSDSPERDCPGVYTSVTVLDTLVTIYFSEISFVSLSPSFLLFCFHLLSVNTLPSCRLTVKTKQGGVYVGIWHVLTKKSHRKSLSSLHVWMIVFPFPTSSDSLWAGLRQAVCLCYRPIHSAW